MDHSRKQEHNSTLESLDQTYTNLDQDFTRRLQQLQGDTASEHDVFHADFFQVVIFVSLVFTLLRLYILPSSYSLPPPMMFDLFCILNESGYTEIVTYFFHLHTLCNLDESLWLYQLLLFFFLRFCRFFLKFFHCSWVSGRTFAIITYSCVQFTCWFSLLT